ncbi:MAG: ABC transporter ATP-binding protein [Victivallaceae bacterium]|nr:ABC transporter ATP-binding protein [Victivallaceae bacterium]
MNDDMMTTPILELHGVERTYRTGAGALPVLKGVDLSLARGAWCCVFGASGSGKTTLLNLVGALETPDAGTICVDGCDVSRLSRSEAARFRRVKIGFVFQAYHLLPELSALENVALAGRLAGMSAHAATQKAKTLLAETGLGERLNHRPRELSGGEQQRAAIARALMNDPALLLADEPTGNLDAEKGRAILDLFVELRRRDPSRSILMITHNPEIGRYADRVVVLRDGILYEDRCDAQ